MPDAHRRESAVGSNGCRTGDLPEWLQEDMSGWPDEAQRSGSAIATIYVDTATGPQAGRELALALYDDVVAGMPEVATLAEGKSFGGVWHSDGDLGFLQKPTWQDGLTPQTESLSHMWGTVWARGRQVASVRLQYKQITLAKPGNLMFGVLVKFGLGESDFEGPATRVAEIAFRFANRINPAYGQVGIKSVSFSAETILDGALQRAGWESANNSRTYLRGYGWVTICPQELADQLGGAERLAASGAFFAVRPLAGGGVWLQATETPTGYRPTDAEAVFDVLRPVLPPGQPNNDRSQDLRWIVMEDAHPQPA
jgi:hypothetical protein